MNILIEGVRYKLETLLEVFEDPKFFIQEGVFGTVNCVGYYHSFTKNKLIYILPKVFLNEGKAFGFTPEELFNPSFEIAVKHSKEYLWVRQLLVYFYNGIAEFRSRYRNSIIAESVENFELNSNLGLTEYSYLDLILSFVNFYKKNKNTILYHHIEYITNTAHKAKWEKTIRKTLPVVLKGQLLYTEIRNKRKAINQQEELLSYYFSILNHFNKEHNLSIQIDKSYKILKGKQFEKLQRSGLSKLRKIKHRYFADTLKRIYKLCELYFSKTDSSSLKRKTEEFIIVRNYNIVFEDMVDKLFSEEVYNDKVVDDVSIEKLKHNNDGKIIDHIYQYNSLIDKSNIFYIGDSKYYKPGNEAGKLSIYKQFTYAKNVIQFNIDLLNESRSYKETLYRDDITEGYNISPNFFLYGYINTESYDFDNPMLLKTESIKKSYHFKERLFDRDTLFVLQYKINFLFVLKYYTANNFISLTNFRKDTKELFRKEFLNYFNDYESCNFKIYEGYFEKGLEEFVDDNFKLLLGKSFKTSAKNLLVAIHREDKDKVKLEELIKDFQIKKL